MDRYKVEVISYKPKVIDVKKQLIVFSGTIEECYAEAKRLNKLEG